MSIHPTSTSPASGLYTVQINPTNLIPQSAAIQFLSHQQIPSYLTSSQSASPLTHLKYLASPLASCKSINHLHSTESDIPSYLQSAVSSGLNMSAALDAAVGAGVRRAEGMRKKYSHHASISAPVSAPVQYSAACAQQGEEPQVSQAPPQAIEPPPKEASPNLKELEDKPTKGCFGFFFC